MGHDRPVGSVEKIPSSRTNFLPSILLLHIRDRSYIIPPQQEIAMRHDLDGLIRALALVHIGQQLGTQSRLSRFVFEIVETLLSIWR